MNNINAHSLNQNRNKRGLIDGLGSVIKFISGNLDSEDGRRYDKLLKDIQNNQNQLKEQVKLSYSLSNNLIQKFNETVNDIQHNQNLIKSRIVQLSILIKDEMSFTNLLFLKDIFNQLIILYNSILNIIEEIENSITFCKLRTLHPSIIQADQLFLEIKRINSIYGNQLPFQAKFENIFNFESLLRINCKISFNRITYLISLPINYETEYNLYYLYPVPLKQGSEYIIMVPNVKYILKSIDNKIIKPLRDICVQSTNMYQCPDQLLVNGDVNCEKNVLVSETPKNCEFIKLNIPNNHIEIIPELNQYLVIFPHEDNLQIKCRRETHTEHLSGIFLIKNEYCEIYYKNNKLTYQQETSIKPLLLPNPKFEIKKQNIINVTFKLKDIKLKEITTYPIFPEVQDTLNISSPSIWTILLYIFIFSTIIILSIRHLINRRKKSSAIEEENSEVRRPKLPGEASF